MMGMRYERLSEARESIDDLIHTEGDAVQHNGARHAASVDYRWIQELKLVRKEANVGKVFKPQTVSSAPRGGREAPAVRVITPRLLVCVAKTSSLARTTIPID